MVRSFVAVPAIYTGRALHVGAYGDATMYVYASIVSITEVSNENGMNERMTSSSSSI